MLFSCPRAAVSEPQPCVYSFASHPTLSPLHPHSQPPFFLSASDIRVRTFGIAALVSNTDAEETDILFLISIYVFMCVCDGVECVLASK